MPSGAVFDDTEGHDSVLRGSGKPLTVGVRPKKPNALECRICEETFTLQGEKVPRLLSCGHSVCHECLTNIQLHGLVILCPFDRQPTDIGDSGIWGLKKNFALLELLERLQSGKELGSGNGRDVDEKDVVKCDENESHKADVYCTVCQSNLCAECAAVTHVAKSLAKHRQVPLSEKPRVNPPCLYHPTHLLEFSCLEESCRADSLMCFVCKDYGAHVGHKHALIESEAGSIRESISGAMEHVKSFAVEVKEFSRKLIRITNRIEGDIELQEGSPGVLVSRQSAGTAEEARCRVRAYFQDLRETIDHQEETALLVINGHVREKLCYLRQQQEDMDMLTSRVTAVCLECDSALRRSDAEVIQARSTIVSLLNSLQEQKQLFTDIAGLCHEDADIPFAFTKDHRVHIGPKMEMRVVALGLDGAGKTSILFKLKQNEFVSAITTIGFNVETVEHRSVKFTIWDVGGVQKLRPLWRHYCLNTQAVIFVIDSSNAERLAEAREELSKLVAEKRLKDALILVWANKQDLPGALLVDEIRERLGLHKLCCGRGWNILACSAHTGAGLQDGLNWLAQQLIAEFGP